MYSVQLTWLKSAGQVIVNRPAGTASGEVAIKVLYKAFPVDWAGR